MSHPKEMAGGARPAARDCSAKMPFLTWAHVQYRSGSAAARHATLQARCPGCTHAPCQVSSAATASARGARLTCIEKPSFACEPGRAHLQRAAAPQTKNTCQARTGKICCAAETSCPYKLHSQKCSQNFCCKKKCASGCAFAAVITQDARAVTLVRPRAPPNRCASCAMVIRTLRCAFNTSAPPRATAPRTASAQHGGHSRRSGKQERQRRKYTVTPAKALSRQQWR